MFASTLVSAASALLFFAAPVFSAPIGVDTVTSSVSTATTTITSVTSLTQTQVCEVGVYQIIQSYTQKIQSACDAIEALNLNAVVAADLNVNLIALHDVMALADNEIGQLKAKVDAVVGDVTLVAVGLEGTVLWTVTDVAGILAPVLSRVVTILAKVEATVDTEVLAGVEGALGDVISIVGCLVSTIDGAVGGILAILWGLLGSCQTIIASLQINVFIGYWKVAA